MEVIPAIDILDGRCVRLRLGDYNDPVPFDADPLVAAQRWVDQGAQRLHVVDLNGAKQGGQINSEVVRQIISLVTVKVQVGGGVRHAETAHDLLQAGADRVVFGTAAVDTPKEVHKVVNLLGAERVAVAIDMGHENVRVGGWIRDTALNANDLINSMESLGVTRFVYTDTLRDGAVTHPNFATTAKLIKPGRNIIVAGGVSSLDDITRLAKLGVEGVITGMAIYTGVLDLRAAIATTSNFELGKEIE